MPYPYTPYHIGPSCLLCLLLRKWIDLPVFVLSNFAIDLAVLFVGLCRPISFVQEYIHTLLIGALVGILWASAAHFFFNGFFIWTMFKIRLPYRTNILKKIFSGIIGTWVHIFIDFLYKSDIKLFWPTRLTNPSFQFNRRVISLFLILAFFAAIILYVIISNRSKNREGLFKRASDRLNHTM